MRTFRDKFHHLWKAGRKKILETCMVSAEVELNYGAFIKIIVIFILVTMVTWSDVVPVPGVASVFILSCGNYLRSYLFIYFTLPILCCEAATPKFLSPL